MCFILTLYSDCKDLNCIKHFQLSLQRNDTYSNYELQQVIKSGILNKFHPHVTKKDGYVVYKQPDTEKRTEILHPNMILKPKEAIKAALKTPMLSFMLSKEVKEQNIFRKESKKFKKLKTRKRLDGSCHVLI